MDIFFSDLDRNNVYTLPVLPPEMPDIVRNAKNEEFETFSNGTFNFINGVGLRTFSIDCFLPGKVDKYKWAKSQIDPYELLNFWSNAMEDGYPVRCIMNLENEAGKILNFMCTVENLSYYLNRAMDFKYKLDLKEYRMVDY